MSPDLATLSPAAAAGLRRLLESPLFEMIPLRNAADQASHLQPGSRVSVTASPNKTLEDSLDLAAELADRGFSVTPHLSARMTRDMAHLERLLIRMASLGLTTAFVVGGDADPGGAFADGLALLRGMEEIGHDLSVGVPAYPEGHPDIGDETLARALADKQPLARWMTTQLCFDGAAVRNWLAATRAAGVTLPLMVGVPGVAERMKLIGISARIGVGSSVSFLRKNVGMLSAFVRPGGYDPVELLGDLGDLLADDSVVGFHIYTFNQCETTEAWRQGVLESL